LTTLAHARGKSGRGNIGWYERTGTFLGVGHFWKVTWPIEKEVATSDKRRLNRVNWILKMFPRQTAMGTYQRNRSEQG